MTDAGGVVDPIDSAVQRAHLLAGLRKEDEALEIVEEALEQYPDDDTLQLTWAWLHARLDHWSMAHPVLQRIVGLQPTLPYPIYLLSTVEQALGHRELALSYAEKALELDPEDVRYHLQLAIVVTGGASISAADRAVARQRIASALELVPDRSGVYQSAAELEWRMGDLAAAQRYAEQGLAIDPQDADLLYLRSVLAGATVESYNKGNPTITSLTDQISGMSDILSASPEHAAAGRLLYGRIWSRILRTQGVYFLPLVAVTMAIGIGMGDGPYLGFLNAGAIIAILWPALRLFMSWRVLRKAPATYVRQQVRGGRGARWRLAGTAIAVAVAAASIVSILVVRDPVAVRVLLISIAAGVTIGNVAAAAWFDRYLTSALAAGVLDSSVAGLRTAATFRKAFTSSILMRTAVAAVVGVIALMISTMTRADAAPVLMVAMLGWVGASVFATLRMRRIESTLRDAALEVPATVPGPGTVSGAMLGLATAATAVAFVLALISVPWAPSPRDSHEAYVPTLGGPSECVGRPASRLACIIEQNQERQSTPYPFPTFTVPTFTVPTITVPTFAPDIEIDPGG